MNHCRLCLGLVPNPKDATKLDSKLPGGHSVAEKLSALFGISVDDYWDADSVTVVCDGCADKIKRSASGQLSATVLDEFKRFFSREKQKMHLLVFCDSEQDSNSEMDPVVSKSEHQKENVGQDVAGNAGVSRMVNYNPVVEKRILREIHLGQDHDVHVVKKT